MSNQFTITGISRSKTEDCTNNLVFFPQFGSGNLNAISNRLEREKSIFFRFFRYRDGTVLSLYLHPSVSHLFFLLFRTAGSAHSRNVIHYYCTRSAFTFLLYRQTYKVTFKSGLKVKPIYRVFLAHLQQNRGWLSPLSAP